MPLFASRHIEADEFIHSKLQPSLILLLDQLKNTVTYCHSQEIETMQQDEPRGNEDFGNEYAEAGDTEAVDIEAGNIEAVDMEAVDLEAGDIDAGSIESPPLDKEAVQSTNSDSSSDHKGCTSCSKDVLKNLLALAVLLNCALIAVVIYQHLNPCPGCQPDFITEALTSQNKPLTTKYYDESYMRYVNFSIATVT